MNENEQIGQKFKLKLIEAFIFASEDPVKINLLKQFELDEKKLLILLKKLEIKYEDSGFNLINIDGSYTFRTSEEVSGLLNIGL